MADALPWIDAEDLLRSTGARNTSKSGHELTFSCFGPAHSHGDSRPSAGMNVNTTLWRCRNPACGLHGNAVDYIVALKGYTRSESERVLRERYGGPEIAAEAGALEQEVQRIRALADNPEADRVPPDEQFYRETFGIDWWSVDQTLGPVAYMLDRGFYAATLAHWEIGYDAMSDRITIPIRDIDGKLVGVKGRAWREDHQPRYLSIGDAPGRTPRYGFQTYHKSHHVYGAYRYRGSVVLLEGEFNAMALAQLGIAAVAVAGSEFSDLQRQVIVSRFSEVVIWFDADIAGRAGLLKVAHDLHPFMPVSVVREPPADAAELQRRGEGGLARQLVAQPIPFLQLAMLLSSR